jgi:hypothetical protein
MIFGLCAWPAPQLYNLAEFGLANYSRSQQHKLWVEFTLVGFTPGNGDGSSEHVRLGVLFTNDLWKNVPKG